MNLKHITII